MNTLPTFSVDVDGVDADAAAVDALARLALRLRRRGYGLMLRRPSKELLGLIEFVGLSETLRTEAAAEARTAGRADRCRGKT